MAAVVSVGPKMARLDTTDKLNEENSTYHRAVAFGIHVGEGIEHAG